MIMVRLLFGVYVLYCLEVGLFLLLFPWHPYWLDNAVLDWLPALRPWVTSNWVRGAVSGLGAANLILGVYEVVDYVRRRRGSPLEAATSDSVRDHQPKAGA
ncbi:MAG: hypothetical protein Kow00109_10220 [Acidobacteriota bacterium]